jgi:hypothetical protein
MYTDISNKMKIEKYHTVGTDPNTNLKIVGTEAKSIPLICI